jgi:hypothetical protein
MENTLMFTIEIDPNTSEHVLVASDGDRVPVRQDVWDRLKKPDEIFTEWKKLLQKWAIHLDKAPVLKRECPGDAEYRTLRTAIRTFAATSGGAPGA